MTLRTARSPTKRWTLPSARAAALTSCLGCVSRHGHPPAHLAVDLHHDFTGLRLEGISIGTRPALIDDGARVTKYVPEPVTNMRHDR